MVTATDGRALMAEVSRVMAAPTAAGCTALARQLGQVASGSLPWPEIRVAVLASFTANPLAPFIAAFGSASGILVRPHTSGGDQWHQEALDPSSGLRQFHPDVIVVALALEDLAEPLVYDYLGLDAEAVDRQVADVVSRVGGLVDAIRRWSGAKILFHTFPTPAEPSLGIIDASHERGQTAAVRAIDRGVRARLAPLGDVYFVDVDRTLARVGHTHWHDARMWTLARIPYTTTAMMALAEDYAHYLRAFTGRVRKVLVVDLDDTLWGGIVGEDGPAGIHLGAGYKGRAYVQFQRALRELSRRGVVLAINSKNNLDDAIEVIEQHPSMVLRRDDFAAVRINWQDKATNLVELSEELGLGLDSFVFVDDSAAECDRVRQALPEVLTVHLTGDPATYAHRVSSLRVFDALTFGDQDRARAAQYRSEARRRDLQQSIGSLEEYYRTLEMVMTVEPVSPSTLPRAAELTQRTNQFNLTTRRFTMDELREYLADPAHEGHVFALRDRFGDHGIIGLALLEQHGDTVIVATLLMSCRVLKRTVEDSVLAFVCGRAAARGATLVEGRFKPTRKNALAAALYESHGFARDQDTPDGVQRFVRAVSDPVPASPWIS